MLKSFRYYFRRIPLWVNNKICSIVMTHGSKLPDELYLRIVYRLHMKRRLNLKKPILFSEKLQWLKLYNRRPEYTKMVDKYSAKEFAASIIGDEYIIPTIGVWDSFDEIDFNQLPNQFVLKTTQGGGGNGVVICRDKKSFDKQKAKEKLESALKENIYVTWREWPYKDVQPRILAEEYMEEEDGSLDDYKFSCFNGRANDVMVCCDRNSGDTKFYFFDKNWHLLPLNKRGKSAPKDFSIPKPTCLDEMFCLAEKLSKGLPYARIDLYAVNNRPYFGEITFFPCSGVDVNLLPETEILHGSMITLPSKTVYNG